jgi:membrane associated rhomboid family serine protease
MLLYVASGLAGSVGHVLFSPDSALPTVGASGAISGVMGAYLITFPRARILTLVPIVIFLTTIEIPAFLILLYWLLLQFLSGAASLGADAGQGGVAWFAHVGGFVAGIPLMLALRRPRWR